MKSDKKAAAARENGKKGGAPIKFKGATYGGKGDVCYKCAKPLDETKIVWLNLDRNKNMFTDKPDERGPEYDEVFPFGPDCARKVVNRPL